MMFGLGAFVIVLMLVGMLFCFAVLAGVIWLVGRWLNQKPGPMVPYTPQQQEPSNRYEQGYRSPDQGSETYREDGQQHRPPEPKQEYDQPQAQYPQELPPQ